MEIKYLGHSSFRLKGKQVTVVTDPFTKDSVGINYSSPSAHIVTISHEHADHNATDAVKRKDLPDEPYVIIRGPGEYEVKGVKIYGYSTYHDNEAGKQRGRNTIYLMVIDGVTILHLGDLGHVLSDSLIEQIDDVDVLMVPVGGVYTIDAKDAAKVVRHIEPKIVIPMHFKTAEHSKQYESLAPLGAFLKEMDAEDTKPEPALIIKTGDLPEELHVVVLTS